MGTDIHLTVEHYNEESKRWDSLSFYKKKDDGGFEPVPIYSGRDYELFGLLAGVRGGSSFLGNRYGYLAKPRGVPNDMSVMAQKEWDDGVDEDGHRWYHTPTWYDFCELKNYSYLLNDFSKAIDKRDKTIAKLQETIDELKGVEKDSCDLFSYDGENEDDEKWSGLKSLEFLVCSVEDLLYEYGIYNPKPGQVRLLMWFDS